jgi:hypothetical protein
VEVGDGLPLGEDRAAGGVHVDDEQVFVEPPARRQRPSPPVHREGVAVEDELVVAADLGAVGERQAVAPRVAGDDAPPERELSHLEGRGRDVQEEVRPVLGLPRDRVGLVEPPAPEGLVVPGVLADGQAQAPPLELDGGVVGGGLEMPVLVEDVVGGQQGLGPAGDDLAPVEEDGPVDDGASRAGRVGLHAADDEARLFDPAGGGGQGLPVGAQEVGLFEEVARRVAAQGELRGQHEVGPRRPRLGVGGPHPGDVPGHVADDGVDLGERDLHREPL